MTLRRLLPMIGVSTCVRTGIGPELEVAQSLSATVASLECRPPWRAASVIYTVNLHGHLLAVQRFLWRSLSSTTILQKSRPYVIKQHKQKCLTAGSGFFRIYCFGPCSTLLPVLLLKSSLRVRHLWMCVISAPSQAICCTSFNASRYKTISDALWDGGLTGSHLGSYR